MKARSAKNKGNRFEQYLVKIFREQLDCKAHQTTASGAGLDKNDVILPSYDIEIEAKNRKGQFSLSSDWKQLKAQKTQNMSVLAIRNPSEAEFKETLIVMELGDFIELVIGRNSSPATAELPKELKWKVAKLKASAHEVFKHLDQFE